MAFTKHNDIFHKTNRLQEKILLIQEDMKEINEVNIIIKSGMLIAERKITKRLTHYPRSPILEGTILEVSLWNLIIFEKNVDSKSIKKNQSNSTR